MTTGNDDVIFRREGGLGHITLNRPQALNALTRDMCAAMFHHMREWADDPAVKAVAVDAVPGRAFCAGGDIRAIYEAGRKHDGSVREFFRTEYPLNAAIKHFPKPYIALIDGFAMGGGVGISVHGSHRIVSDKAIFAMPETAIGLFPDVGGTYFMPRLPGEIGMYLALTGARITSADMIYAGIATHHVASHQFVEIPPRLSRGESIDAILAEMTEQAPLSPLAAHRISIDRAFATPSVEAILEALGREGSWGEATAALLTTRSPSALKFTFRAMREGKNLDFGECQRMEYRLMLRAVEGQDFYEGVRAALIDKDQRPRWYPAMLEAVNDAEIDRYFAPMRDEDPIASI